MNQFTDDIGISSEIEAFFSLILANFKMWNRVP